MATSPLPSRWPKRGHNCSVTPKFLGILHKGDKNRIGYPPPPLLGAHNREEVLRNPTLLGGGHQRGTKSEVAISPLPSPGPKRGRNCYVTLAFSRPPNKGDKIRSGYLTLAFLETRKMAGMLCNPWILGGPQQRGQNQKWLPHPCVLGGPKRGCQKRAGLLRNLCAFSGVINKGGKIRNGYLTPTFSGAQERAPKEGRIATYPLHSRGSPTKGTKSEVATSPLPSRWPKRGQDCYVTPIFLGNADKGDKIRSGYLTHAFSGVPNKGDKIRSGCLTPTFSLPQKRGELLRNAFVLGGLVFRAHNLDCLKAAVRV